MGYVYCESCSYFFLVIIYIWCIKLKFILNLIHPFHFCKEVLLFFYQLLIFRFLFWLLLSLKTKKDCLIRQSFRIYVGININLHPTIILYVNHLLLERQQLLRSLQDCCLPQKSHMHHELEFFYPVR